MTPATRKRASRRTSGKSQLLEQCVDALRMIGFQMYDSHPQFLKASVVPSRYVIKGYPHISLYGTKGRKEAFIRADGSEWILEAKWQEAAGSVDEKLPYIWQSFLASGVQHWLVVLDGRYWKTGRGDAAARWLASKGKLKELTSDGQQDPRRFIVTDRKGFIQFAKREWGQP